MRSAHSNVVLSANVEVDADARVDPRGNAKLVHVSE